MHTSPVPAPPRSAVAARCSVVAVAMVALLVGPLAPVVGATPAAPHHAATQRGRSAPAAAATMLVDDYPYKNNARGAVVDTWRFYNGYCTSFVAWRINDLAGRADWAHHKTDSSTAYWKFTNFMPVAGGYVQFSDARNWAAAAQRLGWAVNGTPAVGSIAQYGDGDSGYGSNNHVAVVTRVYDDGYVDVEEYNWSRAGAYDRRIHVRAPRYIHVPGVPAASDVAPAPVSVAPFASPSAYVTQQYVDFTRTAGAASQMAQWTSQINGGTDPGALPAYFLAQDPRFAASTASLTRLYLAYFDRAPDTGGYNAWSYALQTGTALADVSQRFATSTEFTVTYGSLDDGAFVDLVYRNVLDRAADPGGRANWINQLQHGWSRGQVMAGFSESKEFTAKSQPKVDSARLYLAMLRRSPDAGGWANAQAQLRAGTSVAALADALRRSGEYQARFS